MIRFDSLDPDLLQALRDASWHSQRRVDASPWLDSLQQEGYQPNSKAEEILVALGGLVIEPVNKSGPNFSNDEPFNFDPISAGLASGPWHWRLRKLWGGAIFPYRRMAQLFERLRGGRWEGRCRWPWMDLGNGFHHRRRLGVGGLCRSTPRMPALRRGTRAVAPVNSRQ
ncbi:SUKH-3 domain-containing protein [Streptomyces mirabilis]|uniref:SUKH-3 domain-containing protein n=1 Tax=Streptomyces mirabilis TaxID=68239 RepID=UPI00399D7040